MHAGMNAPAIPGRAKTAVQTRTDVVRISHVIVFPLDLDLPVISSAQLENRIIGEHTRPE